MVPQPDNAAPFAPAITALRLELADLERRAAETRSLIEGLCAHAGIADAPEAVPGEPEGPLSGDLMAEQPKAKGTRGAGRPKKGGSRKNPPKEQTLAGQGIDKNLADRGTDKAAAAPAKPNEDKASAAELSEVVGIIAEAAEHVAAATRDKDAKKLQAAVSTWERAERRAGELLAAMNGRVRPLPGKEADKRRWRAAVLLSRADFEIKVRRSQRRALAAIGIGPAPAKQPPQRSQPIMQIGDWREEPDGSRSRTVTAVDGGAEAP
jgi:hypothetical protein